jgi:hypothetical protein
MRTTSSGGHSQETLQSAGHPLRHYDIVKPVRTLRPTMSPKPKLIPQHHSIDSPRVWKLG